MTEHDPKSAEKRTPVDKSGHSELSDIRDNELANSESGGLLLRHSAIPESFLRNSLVIARPDDPYLFAVVNGVTYARLDGYAVIPMETYDALSRARGEVAS